jgi:hypothetical protein
MANLNTKIKLYANQEVDFSKDVILQDDSNGTGAYIKEWNLAIVKPTDVQLATYETAGNTEEALQVILSTRSNAYPTWQEQMDMQYHDLVDGTTTWKDSIQTVKDANPKE